ncbi:hypothetical protein TSAR_016127 [Trichomalopsis sarcophagae]|uniref:Dynein axonemal assembly factor 1 homolog n=1 Tax=Trichomalopsis sarcophagae TaxID=543379 RepID=A0A232FMP9_9HYME|nr:hypothetical protein TSAR_016127 [Trichomalopsis sarcophagae]
MLQSYEPKKPTVVTKELLLTLANEQQSRRRRRRIITALDKIDEIRLEYLNILKIDCLWPLTNLVKLKLNNNAIEKIENLECLKNLCELDLSFNRITTIENLEALENLHILSLYDNQIDVIQGLDHMHSLAILSIGKNFIHDLEHVLYFRKLKGLRSLQVAGNPCTERSGYASYLIAFVPQLIYYSYKMITEKEREEANEKHRRALANILEAEAKKQKEVEAIKAAEEKIAQLSVSYVEYLDEDCLFQQMFCNDDEGTKLAKLNQDTEAAFEQYRQTFSEICHQLYELGLKEESRRREEIQALNNVVEDRLTTATNKARKIMDSVQSKRVEITVRVTQMLREAAIVADDADLDDDAIDEIDKVARQLSLEFNQYIDVVWKKLMREETVIHEQIEEMSRMFETNINDMVTAFLETVQEYFSQLRNLETEYNENLSPIVMTYLNSIEDADKNPFLLSLMEDKDALTNCLAGSHFLHLQVIDDRQDRMVKRLRDWQAKFLQNLVDDETDRSRNRILEITHFLDYHRDNATVAKILGQQSLQMEENESHEAASSVASKEGTDHQSEDN